MNYLALPVWVSGDLFTHFRVVQDGHPERKQLVLDSSRGGMVGLGPTLVRTAAVPVGHSPEVGVDLLEVVCVVESCRP